MSRALPRFEGRERPSNTVNLLREAFVALNERAHARLAGRGHGVVRVAHGAVFQYLDDTGTPVARLAERAQITKQAMSELVAHLERHGYVVRRPDPADRRAKLVTPTAKGMEVFELVVELVPEIESDVDALLGVERAAALRDDLKRLSSTLVTPRPLHQGSPSSESTSKRARQEHAKSTRPSPGGDTSKDFKSRQ